MRYVVLVLLAVALALALADRDCSCSTHRTCGACIGSGCQWCADPGGKSRGFQGRCSCPGTESDCKESYPMLLPEEKKLDIIKDSLLGKEVQMRPQYAKLKLHVGESVKFKLHFKQSSDYPVDLYYLMDLSDSMKDVRDRVAGLGKDLADVMRNVTSNFRLGFGSFVEKFAEPFSNESLYTNESVCYVENNKRSECIKPYSFKHHMDLGTNTDLFNARVKNTLLSQNRDSPEAIFDAVMQSVVCQKQIGWRQVARHLLVVSTDATFHYAGDGRLLGILTPNDMACHLNTEGEYTHSLKLDYPSIAQISHVLKKHYINLIFVVKQQVTQPYRLLSKELDDTPVLTLSKNSSNVLQLIQSGYKELMEKVVMIDTANKSYISVQFNSSCKGFNPETRMCQTDMYEEVEYEVEIMAEKCPDNRSEWRQVFEIFPPKLRDKMVVEVNLQCECGCEQKGHKAHAPECSGKGTLKCGVCDCDKGIVGSWCQCDPQEGVTRNESTCRRQGDSEGEPVCSGNGFCECGICECSKFYSGEFCECSNIDCPRSNGRICAGHGSCQCGRCQCQTGWKGESCQCPVSDIKCIPTGGGEVCSGHGVCECGVCKCTVPYTGNTCEDCKTCPGEQCESYREYIHHKVFDAKCSSEKKCTNPGIEIVRVDQVKAGDGDREKGIEYCQFIDDDDCVYYFRYFSGNTTVEVQRTKKCQSTVDMLALVLGLIGGIVIIGLLLLVIWKTLTTIHDRREFAKFDQERKNARWHLNENPIHRRATSTFENPIYNVNEPDMPTSAMKVS